MIARSLAGVPKRYSNKPVRARRSTKSAISRSTSFAEENEASGSPVPMPCARFSASMLYLPSGSENSSKVAMTLPSLCACKCTCALMRADRPGAGAFRFCFFAGARTQGSSMRQEGRQLAFPERFVREAHPDRDIVQTARREAFVEMPQARREHAHHGHADIGPGLVEHEEIEASASGHRDAGFDLLAHAVERHLHAQRRRRQGIPSR